MNTQDIKSFWLHVVPIRYHGWCLTIYSTCKVEPCWIQIPSRYHSLVIEIEIVANPSGHSSPKRRFVIFSSVVFRDTILSFVLKKVGVCEFGTSDPWRGSLMHRSLDHDAPLNFSLFDPKMELFYYTKKVYIYPGERKNILSDWLTHLNESFSGFVKLLSI